MDKPTGSILLIDDDEIFCHIMEKEAKREGLNLTSITSLSRFSGPSDLADYDTFLIDYDLDDMTGFQLAEYLYSRYPEKPVVMISATERPWQEGSENLPNIQGFISKWSGRSEILSAAVKAGGETFPLLVNLLHGEEGESQHA